MNRDQVQKTVGDARNERKDLRQQARSFTRQKGRFSRPFLFSPRIR